ncbi:MAG TPA: hypothetical protein VK735_36655, partial [Pseudonocardia sp.]|uniref:hypothetical protein n=1 Tax=Pseudonocardia sp. TaxID=60912 RepID=UPI002CBA9DEF
MTTQRRTSTPQTSPGYPEDPGPEAHRDEHPTEVFTPVWDGDSEEPTAEEWDQPARGDQAGQPDHAARADQGTERLDPEPEYPT